MVASAGSSRGKNAKANTPLAVDDASSIPREELMHLSMKLSKRLKKVESKLARRSDKLKSMENRCMVLEELIESIIGHKSVSYSEMDAGTLRNAVVEWQHKKAATTDALNSKNLSQPGGTSLITETLGKKPEVEPSSLEPRASAAGQESVLELANSVPKDCVPSYQEVTQQRSFLEESNASLGRRLKEEREKSSKLHNHLEEMKVELEKARSTNEEQILYLKLKLDKMKRQLQESEDVHGQMPRDHLHEKSDFMEKIAAKEKLLKESDARNISLQSELSRRAKLVETQQTAELKEKLHSTSLLQSSHKSVAAEATQRAEQAAGALTDTMAEAERFKVRVQEQRVELQMKHDMVVRLQANLDAAAAQRAEALTELQKCKREKTDVEEALAASRDKVEHLDTELHDYREHSSHVSEKLNAAQSENEELKKSLSGFDDRVRDLVEKERAKLESKYLEQKSAANQIHAKEMDVLRRDFQKRGAKARMLVEQKEKEKKLLQSRVEVLTEEIESGRPQERKILQFAQEQARREAQQMQMKEANQNLEKKVHDMSLQLELYRKQEENLRRTLTGLQQKSTHGGVNLLYLRNVVLRYMAFKTGSSERLHLVPVIASILNYTKKELKTIEGATNNLVKSWWKSARQQRLSSQRQKSKKKQESSSNIVVSPTTASPVATSTVMQTRQANQGRRLGRDANYGHTKDSLDAPVSTGVVTIN